MGVGGGGPPPARPRKPSEMNPCPQAGAGDPRRGGASLALQAAGSASYLASTLICYWARSTPAPSFPWLWREQPFP